jgi:hypothetical protein
MKAQNFVPFVEQDKDEVVTLMTTLIQFRLSFYDFLTRVYVYDFYVYVLPLYTLMRIKKVFA